jgi:tetratricopeptide (TPR) repeat protein
MLSDNEEHHQDKKIDIAGDVTNGVVITGNKNNVQQHITSTTNTGGGAAIAGDIKVENGDLVGRDKIKKVKKTKNITNNFLVPSTTTHLTGSAPAYPQLMLGREDTLSEIKTYLGVSQNEEISAIRRHLVVVHGWPGVGKTTLVAALAHNEDVQKAFPEGVLWASLGPDPNLFSWLMAWGRSLNTDITNARTLAEASAQLTALLLAQKRLIIVDDVWDPKHALPFNVGGSGCALLITTRNLSVAQALAPTANDIYRLNTLDDKKSMKVLQELAPTVMEQNPKELNELLTELGGLPLALQVVGHLLNKQAMRGFRMKDLLTELRKGESLLGSIVPIGMEKMEKIESTISVLFKKSTDPLGEKTINYFASLSVFAHPPVTFDVTAMQAVWQVENPKSATTELIDQGLLEYVPEQQSYRMHALLHQHAQSLLTDKDAQKARRNHFNFFQRFAANYPDTELSKWGTDKIQEFEALYPQLKQALANFYKGYGVAIPTTGAEQIQQVIKLIDTLDKYWVFHNNLAEQVEWLTVAYQSAQLLNSALQAAGFARRIGHVKGILGDWDDGFKWLEICETTLGSDPSWEASKIRASMHIERAFIHYQQESPVELAKKDCLLGLGMVTKKTAPEIYAIGYNLLGAIKLATSKISAAKKDFEKSLSAWQQVENNYQIARVEDNIKVTHVYLGNLQYLREAGEKNLQAWEKSSNPIEFAMALINRAETHCIDGELDAAIERQKQAIEISQDIKVPRIEALAKSNLARSYASIGEYDTALVLLKESQDIRHNLGMPEYSIDARLCLVGIELGRKNYNEALKNAKIAMQEAREDNDPLEKGCAQRALGQIYHLQGKTEQARKQLEQSFSQLEKNEYRYESFLTLQELIKIYQDTGDIEKAQVGKQKSQDLSYQMGLLPPKA